MAYPLTPGTILRDWSQPGVIVEVVEVTSGKMPTPIDTTVPSSGHSTGACALFVGSSGSKHAVKPGTKGQP